MALNVEQPTSTDLRSSPISFRQHQESIKGTPLWISREVFRERFLAAKPTIGEVPFDQPIDLLKQFAGYYILQVWQQFLK